MWSIREQRSEFVKRGNLGGAGARELLFNPLDHGVRQHAAHRTDDAVAVGLRRGLRVNFKDAQIWHIRYLGDLVADADAKHLPHIGGRVGADQQHALVQACEFQCAGAGDGCFADTALAGEEQKARGLFERFHLVLNAKCRSW
jgi:hypothetical protein